MLPIPETLSKTTNERKFREYLLSQNRFLSSIFNQNLQTQNYLVQILESYESSKSTSQTQCSNSSRLRQIFEVSEDFNSRLKLCQTFPVSLCKSKYFKLTAELGVNAGIEVIKEDRATITVSLYSYDAVPKQITHTMQGKNIFRGKTQSTLAYDIVEGKHLVHFKLQIKEVSSHFVGGMFYLVLEADHNLDRKGIVISPLVIKNVKVKAKDS